jgi:hypothetical protein
VRADLPGVHVTFPTRECLSVTSAPGRVGAVVAREQRCCPDWLACFGLSFLLGHGLSPKISDNFVVDTLGFRWSFEYL